MAKEKKADSPQPTFKYRQLAVADLHRGRRGKHHDLSQGIPGELKAAPPGSALEIPLAESRRHRTCEPPFGRASRLEC